MAQLERRDWTVTDLAMRMQLRPATVSRWLNGQRTPDPAYCRRIAEALGIPADEVLRRAGHRDEPPGPIDLNDPLTSFAAANQHKLTRAQKRALVEMAKAFLAEQEP